MTREHFSLEAGPVRGILIWLILTAGLALVMDTCSGTGPTPIIDAGISAEFNNY
jgi:hypothetical protein